MDREREKQINKRQGDLRGVLESSTEYVQASLLKEAYYDMNYLLEELRKARELVTGGQ